MRAAIGLRLGRVQAALRGQAVECRAELRDGRSGGAVARIKEAHRVPGLRRHLGDAGTHDAGADDEDDAVGAKVEAHATIIARTQAARLCAAAPDRRTCALIPQPQMRCSHPAWRPMAGAVRFR